MENPLPRASYGGVDEGAGAISKTLETNATLTTLNLSWNKIGDEGAGAISKTLKANITLTTLNLSFNSIGNAGVEVISEALKTNSTLTELGLMDSGIGNEGVRLLSEALKANSALTKLDLRGNYKITEVFETDARVIWNYEAEEEEDALSEAPETGTTLTNP